MDQKSKWLVQLDRVKKIASGSKLDRLICNSKNYILGVGYYQLIYPFTKKGWSVTAKTFFDESITVRIPSGLDIFIAGGKTHDSEIRLARYFIHRVLPAPGLVFFDIGAHFGYFSRLVAKLGLGSVYVHAFEASKSTFSVLSKNCAGLPQVKAHHLAVAAKDGTLTFTEFPDLYAEYNTLDTESFKSETWYQKTKAHQISVKAMTLNGFCLTHQTSPELIKIDVEGSELEVIKGLVPLLEKGEYPEIILEVWMDKDRNEAHKEAIRILQSFHYEMHQISDQGRLNAISWSEFRALESSTVYSENLVFKRSKH